MSRIRTLPSNGGMLPRNPPSMFYEVMAQYKRLYGGNVIECIGVDGESAHSLCIQSSHLHTSQTGAKILEFDDCRMDIHYRLLEVTNSTKASRMWLSCEMRYPGHISGVIFIFAPESGQSRGSKNCSSLSRAGHTVCDELDSREWLALTLLSQPAARISSYGLSVLKTIFWQSSLTTLFEVLINNQAEMICSLFEQQFLYRSSGQDHWDSPNGGRVLFIKKAEYFVQQHSPVYFCLPAFPCKSTNTNKVASMFPDGGEYEALTTLHKFCVEARKLYPPGCHIEIVSDGHVFADCIGVDDHLVTTYNQLLQEMSDSVHRQLQTTMPLSERHDNQISFVGLHKILFPSRAANVLLCPTQISTNICHPVRTLINFQDDINRRLLLQHCKPPSNAIHHMIKTDCNHTLTQLYRGFSRFMLDDLAFHPDSHHISNSQRRRIAGRVGLEMMQRNQSYSHLIQLTRPRHIRLSIHAHDNSGAKIAISLLPPSKFQALRSFDTMTFRQTQQVNDDFEPNQTQHLHIPTPWHNVLVEIEHHQKVYVCKSGIVEDELLRPDSPWSPSQSGYIIDHPRGGRYVLKLKLPESEASSSVGSNSPVLMSLPMISGKIIMPDIQQDLLSKHVEGISMVEICSV